MTDQHCAIHTKRQAATVCAACGRPLCRDCVVYTGVGLKCAACTGGKAVAANPAVQRVREWRPTTVGVTVAVVVVLLAGMAAFAIFRPSPMQQVGGAQDASAGASGSDHATHDVAFASEDGLTLRGTLTVPEDQHGHAPAVVIVPGFGSTDRDGATGPADPVYRDMAAALAEQGLISLRYDNVGVGESDPAPDGPPTFERRVDHAAAAVASVRDRPEVDAGHVALIGHDEGGLVAMGVAGDDANLAGLVLVATPGRPYAEVMIDAFRASDDEEHDAVAEEIEWAVAELLETGELPEVDQSVGMGIGQLLPEGQDEFLYSVFSLEPNELAAEVTSPVLIVHPERLPQVGRDTDVEPLREALVGAPEVDVLVRPDAGYTLNLLDDDATGNETGPADGVRGRDEAALDAIAEWLAGHAVGG